MKGIALSHYQDSLLRHILAWAEGDTSEDHMGAILWNAAAMDWTEGEIAAGRLPAALNDLPYRQGVKPSVTTAGRTITIEPIKMP